MITSRNLSTGNNQDTPKDLSSWILITTIFVADSNLTVGSSVTVCIRFDPHHHTQKVNKPGTVMHACNSSI
jgi:hypothetical protein